MQEIPHDTFKPNIKSFKSIIIKNMRFEEKQLSINANRGKLSKQEHGLLMSL